MSIKLNANVKNQGNNDVGDEKHYILYCNAPDIVKLRAMFIESILATSKGIPQLIGKFLNGIIEFLKDK